MHQIQKNTALVKRIATELGFSYCGIAKAEYLNEDARRLEAWLNQNLQGKMQYMENHFDLRVDPRKLVPGAKSVITVLQNYYPEYIQDTGTLHIAKYAFGNDYHDVIRTKLRNFLNQLQENLGAIEGRGFVDFSH